MTHAEYRAGAPSRTKVLGRLVYVKLVLSSFLTDTNSTEAHKFPGEVQVTPHTTLDVSSPDPQEFIITILLLVLLFILFCFDTCSTNEQAGPGKYQPHRVRRAYTRQEQALNFQQSRGLLACPSSAALHLTWSPLIPIGPSQLAEQVLEHLPSTVTRLEPQVDAEGSSPVPASTPVWWREQPHPTSCSLHTHPSNELSSTAATMMHVGNIVALSRLCPKLVFVVSC